MDEEIKTEKTGEINPTASEANVPGEADQPSWQQALAELKGWLQGEFSRKVYDDTIWQTRFRELHAELETHKSKAVFKYLQPVLTALGQFYTRLEQRDYMLRRLPPEEQKKISLFDELQAMREEVEVILANAGAEIFRCPETKFDPIRQRSRQATPTSNKDLDKVVYSRLSPGISYEGRIFQQEEVNLLIYDPTAKRAGEGKKSE